MAASEKPGKGNRIFISTVSNEFEKLCFRQAPGGTLDKLDAYIRDSDAEAAALYW